MKIIDIAEAIQNMVEEKILKDWKHEGYVDGLCVNGTQVCIDGKRYLIEIREVKDLMGVE